ncbi:MAG: hypothetical protein LEGION0398_MBIBDBAK_01444 [Legionellaceae bacterium]
MATLSSQNSGEKPTVIDLYHSFLWEERLLGYWVINKNTYVFIEGEFVKALQNGYAIEIKNAPQEDERFRAFWDQMHILSYIDDLSGRRINIPSTVKFSQSEGYSWDTLSANISWEENYDPKAIVLNPGNLQNFFIRYTCDNTEHTLLTHPGYIATHTQQNLLNVNLTRNLQLNEWVELLTACQQASIQLKVHYLPEMNLPTELISPSLKISLPNHQRKAWEGTVDTTTMSIVSTDSDTTVSQIVSTQEAWKIINVSELNAEDLLVRTISDFDAKNYHISFTENPCVLLQALNNKENIILQGYFSQTLIDALAPLLLKRQYSSQTDGQLVLITEDETFHYLPIYYHEVSIVEKQNSLAEQFSDKEIDYLDENILIKESRSQLQARLTYLRINPHAELSDAAWQGIYSLENQRQSNNEAKSLMEKVNEIFFKPLEIENKSLENINSFQEKVIELQIEKASNFITKRLVAVNRV